MSSSSGQILPTGLPSQAQVTSADITRDLWLGCHTHIPRCCQLKESGDFPRAVREGGGCKLLVNTRQDKSGLPLEYVSANCWGMERRSAVCRLLTINCTDINSQERLLSLDSYSILNADVRHRKGNFHMTEWFASSSLWLVGSNTRFKKKKKDCLE